MGSDFELIYRFIEVHVLLFHDHLHHIVLHCADIVELVMVVVDAVVPLPRVHHVVEA